MVVHLCFFVLYYYCMRVNYLTDLFYFYSTDFPFILQGLTFKNSDVYDTIQSAKKSKHIAQTE